MNIILGKILTLSLFLAPNLLLGQINPDENSPPNVLFIAIDDLNDWTGFLGGHPQAKTPKLDLLAESGITFTNAYASAPVCGPSRTALLYGKYPHKTGSYGHHQIYNPQNLNVFDSLQTIPAAFHENGYYTAGAGKIFHYQNDQKDFQTYFYPSDGKFPAPHNNKSFYPDGSAGIEFKGLVFGPLAPEDVGNTRDKKISDWAIQQLQKEHKKPFFIGVGFQRPHLPWTAPKQYFDKYNENEIQLPTVQEEDLADIPHAGKIFSQSLFGFYRMDEKSDHEFITEKPMLWKKFVKAYLATTNYVDAMVGRVLDALKFSRYSDNTIIVLWGDHGWHLGEKEHWRKMTLWERGTKTPLIFYVPGNSNNGSRVKQPVSLQDIYPTLAELCNLEIKQELDGNSLVPLLSNPSKEKKWNKPVLMSHGPGNFAIRSRKWRYIKYQNGDEELYDISTDEYEFYNLTKDKNYRHIKNRLRKFIPDEFVQLYGPRFNRFQNLGSIEIK